MASEKSSGSGKVQERKKEWKTIHFSKYMLSLHFSREDYWSCIHINETKGLFIFTGKKKNPKQLIRDFPYQAKNPVVFSPWCDLKRELWLFEESSGVSPSRPEARAARQCRWHSVSDTRSLPGHGRAHRAILSAGQLLPTRAVGPHLGTPVGLLGDCSSPKKRVQLCCLFPSPPCPAAVPACLQVLGWEEAAARENCVMAEGHGWSTAVFVFGALSPQTNPSVIVFTLTTHEAGCKPVRLTWITA